MQSENSSYHCNYCLLPSPSQVSTCCLACCMTSFPPRLRVCPEAKEEANLSREEQIQKKEKRDTPINSPLSLLQNTAQQPPPHNNASCFDCLAAATTQRVRPPKSLHPLIISHPSPIIHHPSSICGLSTTCSSSSFFILSDRPTRPQSV